MGRITGGAREKHKHLHDDIIWLQLPGCFEAIYCIQYSFFCEESLVRDTNLHYKDYREMHSGTCSQMTSSYSCPIKSQNFPMFVILHSEKLNQEKSPNTCANLVNFSNKLCRTCLIITKYYYCDYRIRETFHMFSLLDLRFMLCSRDLDVACAQKIMDFISLITHKSTRLENPDHVELKSSTGRRTLIFVHRVAKSESAKILWIFSNNLPFRPHLYNLNG